jgi:hypothetical protein
MHRRNVVVSASWVFASKQRHIIAASSSRSRSAGRGTDRSGRHRSLPSPLRLEDPGTDALSRHGRNARQIYCRRETTVMTRWFGLTNDGSDRTKKTGVCARVDSPFGPLLGAPCMCLAATAAECSISLLNSDRPGPPPEALLSQWRTASKAIAINHGKAIQNYSTFRIAKPQRRTLRRRCRFGVECYAST